MQLPAPSYTYPFAVSHDGVNEDIAALKLPLNEPEVDTGSVVLMSGRTELSN